MQAESGHNNFIISPAKSLLFFDLILVALVLFMLVVMPIVFSVKLIVIMLILWYGLVTIADFSRAKAHQLQYKPETGQWLFNRVKVQLQGVQFLTRYLLVVNVYTESGVRLNPVIPIDSMPKSQHIRLRQLMIAWSKNPNRDG